MILSKIDYRDVHYGCLEHICNFGMNGEVLGSPNGRRVVVDKKDQKPFEYRVVVVYNVEPQIPKYRTIGGETNGE